MFVSVLLIAAAAIGFLYRKSETHAQGLAYTVELVETLTTTGYLGGPARDHEIVSRQIHAQRPGVVLDHYFHLGMPSQDGGRTHMMDDGTLIDQNGTHMLARYLKSVTTINHSQRSFSWPTPASDCTLNGSGRRAFPPGAVLSGTDTVLGYRAVIQTLPGGAKKWLAPDVGCALVGAETTFRKDPSGATETSRLTAVRISVGEPDEALFSLAGLDELSPRQAYERKMTYLGFNDVEKEAHRKSNEANLSRQEAKYNQK